MPRPHILVILTDDHSAHTLGCYGNREIRSTNIDHLAATGVCFDRATCLTPVCSPARASFWTGTIPSWHGVHDHLGGLHHPGIGEQRHLGHSLQAAGYRTAMIGKWHCHAHSDAGPKSGFDRWFTQYQGTCARFGEQVFWNGDQGEQRHGHQAVHLTDEAIAFLRANAAEEQPLFCFVGFTDTHTPFAGMPERLVEHYRRTATFHDIPDEEYPAIWGRARYPFRRDSAEGREGLAQYYAAVQMIDEQVGRLLDELDNLGMSEDSLVIYTSDHGHCNGHHGIACKGNGTVPQNAFHESLQIPLIARLPGRTSAGRRIAAPVDHCDTHRSLLHLTGANAVDDAPRPGQDWLPLAQGDAVFWRRHQCFEYGTLRGIEDERFKLVRYHPGPNGDWPDLFIDRACDPRETRNLIDNPEQQQQIHALDTRLSDFFTAYGNPEQSGLGVGGRALHNGAEPWRAPRETTG
jgi:choline-sulfatase